MDRDDGFIQGLSSADSSLSVYYGIKTDSRFKESQITLVSAVVPLTGDRYVPLHVEVTGNAAADVYIIYYNNQEKVYYPANTADGDVSDYHKTLVATFVNISFAGFSQMAKDKYTNGFRNSMYSNNVLTNSIAYDKYMYYWATAPFDGDAAYNGMGIPNVTWPFANGYQYNSAAASPTGSQAFWQQFYGTGLMSEFPVNDSTPAARVKQKELSMVTHKYIPLFQRMEAPEEDDAAAAGTDEKKVQVTTW
jgi:hypothetical protein